MITPYVLQGPHGLDARAKQSVILATGGNAIALGSFVTSAGVGSATGETTAAYIVDAILLADGLTLKQNQYLTATEATAGTYNLRVTDLTESGVTFAIGEDGTGGVITDTQWFTDGKVHTTLTVTAPSGDTALNESSADGRGAAHANIKLDSSVVQVSSSSMEVKILRPISPANFDKNAVTTTQPSTWSAASKGRVWECQLV